LTSGAGIQFDHGFGDTAIAVSSQKGFLVKGGMWLVDNPPDETRACLESIVSEGRIVAKREICT